VRANNLAEAWTCALHGRTRIRLSAAHREPWLDAPSGSRASGQRIARGEEHCCGPRDNTVERVSIDVNDDKMQMHLNLPHLFLVVAPSPTGSCLALPMHSIVLLHVHNRTTIDYQNGRSYDRHVLAPSSSPFPPSQQQRRSRTALADSSCTTVVSQRFPPRWPKDEWAAAW
jgi:hypothetical protein